MKQAKLKAFKILVIDDEPAICKFLEIEMKAAKYTVVTAENGKKGMAKIVTEQPDLVILDLGLPDINGHIVLKKIRQSYKNPVIILSAQSAEQDIIQALDNGANDYLIKPFRTGELLARIRTCLRNIKPNDHSGSFNYPGLEIDTATRTVKKNGQYLKLTVTQYDLLLFFCKNEGKVLTHHHILKEVWGEDHITQLEYLRVFVAQLRKKIEDEGTGIRKIFSESGIGYRFVASQD
jgi:two-component system KDP operon response regulator KdpE